MSDPSGQATGREAGPSLTGVGVGPGDPELLTLKALRAIQAADVVFAPVRRAGESSLALEIAGQYLDRTRQQVVVLPFPETAGDEAWDPAARQIVETVGRDRSGVFLVEGDPLLFGSFAHVAACLARAAPWLRVRVVPGVSSVVAAAAAAGVALADHGERIAILPATYHLDDLERTLRAFECVVLLKVARVLPEVLRLLARLEVLDDTTYVRRCGRPEQAVIHDVRTLLADPPRDYFSLLIVRRRPR
ncbi:MAG: precorrin-2 C(20)-methyltransferase [Chloroflexi bacterium]|nr:precorrin-2 C(20)-methyltransferase [Chloroflexota bacterium]